jgi:pilus assembly protein CpaD
MASVKSSAALLVLGISLGACVHEPATNGLSAHYNPSLYSVNQPVVQRTDYVFDMGAGGGVAPADLQRLGAWFDSLELGYGDRVSLDSSSGYLDPASREAIARVAGSYGLLISDGAPVTGGRPQEGAVRIVVSRMTASVPDCPQWNSEEIGARVTTSPNYGCATNGNLAAMIADPMDLVRGQTSEGGIDAATYSKTVKVFRDRKPTGVDGAIKTESAGGK